MFSAEHSTRDIPILPPQTSLEAEHGDSRVVLELTGHETTELLEAVLAAWERAIAALVVR